MFFAAAHATLSRLPVAYQKDGYGRWRGASSRGTSWYR
jgi:hypothetical protein